MPSSRVVPPRAAGRTPPVLRWTAARSAAAGAGRTTNGPPRQLSRIRAPPTSLAADGSLARYFATSPPAGSLRHAVVVFGGAGGGLGLSPTTAALLASHGLPAVGIAYFAAPGLPPTLSAIPLEYFITAVNWL